MNNIGPCTKSALEFIRDHPRDPPYIIVTLSNEFHTTPATTRRLISRLKTRNLIQHAPPKIGAGNPLQLTPKGHSVLAGNWHL